MQSCTSCMQLRNKGDAYMQQVDRIRMIDDRRQKQGLSYRQLADMAGVSYTTVYRAISGRCCPEAATLEMLESALGIVDGVDVIHARRGKTFRPWRSGISTPRKTGSPAYDITTICSSAPTPGGWLCFLPPIWVWCCCSAG